MSGWLWLAGALAGGLFVYLREVTRFVEDET